MSTIKANQWLNTDGTENYKCRAWVNFNGSGTVAIRAAGNVASITDNATGDYTVNFTTALEDANYCVTAAVNANGVNGLQTIEPVTYATSSLRVNVRSAQTTVLLDNTILNMAIFR